ncbi:MAG: sulfite exporter TauE/SafE family protein [Dehalococcoidia bacterium]
MDILDSSGIGIGAFVAGAINAVAGGGSLVSFPTLIAVGYEAKVANVTNTVALWPGYLGGSIGYRHELDQQRRRILEMLPACVVGAIAGSAILLATSAEAFEAIVPYLILFACAILALQDRIASFVLRHHPGDGSPRFRIVLQLAIFALAVYGAYFGAGLGILTLAVLGILLPDDLQRSNALKGMLSLLINAIAVVYFALWGPVRWAPALLMAVAALAGGYLGVGVARKLGSRWLRVAVIVYSVLVASVLLVR